MKCESIIIKGVNGINAVSMYKNNQNYEVVGNDYIQKDEWVLNTSGINLLELFKIMILIVQKHIQMIFMRFMKHLVLKQQEKY